MAATINDIKRTVSLWAEGFFNLIFPDVCTVCHRQLVNGERIMCLDCALGLPRTNLHLTQPNAIHERILSVGHPVVRAASMFYYYRENKYASLIHDMKYRGRPVVGRFLASQHAEELTNVGFFDGVDAIVPVPLHFFKRLRRGYNQAEEIALGLSSVTGLPVVNALSASLHSSQTRKNAHQRLLNVRGAYSVSDKDAIDGRHILLVDDVITTGATLLSCLEMIKNLCPTTRVSVYSLAITQLG